MAVRFYSWFILVLTLQCLTPTPTTWVQVHALRFDLPNGPTPTVTVGQQATATWIANSPNDQNGFVLLLNCDTSDNPDNFSFSNLKSDLTPVFPHRQTQGEFSRNVTQAGSCHFQGYQVQFHDFKGQTVKLGASDPLLAVTSPEAQAQPLASTPTQTGAQATTQSSTTSPTRTLTPGSTSSKTSSSAAAGGGALGSETSEISQASTPTTAHAEGGINSLPLNDPGSTTVTNFSTSTVTAASTTSSLESSNNGEAKNDKEKIILGSVCGILSLVILMLLFVFFIIRRRRRRRRAQKPQRMIGEFTYEDGKWSLSSGSLSGFSKNQKRFSEVSESSIGPSDSISQVHGRLPPKRKPVPSLAVPSTVLSSSISEETETETETTMISGSGSGFSSESKSGSGTTSTTTSTRVISETAGYGTNPKGYSAKPESEASTISTYLPNPNINIPIITTTPATPTPPSTVVTDSQ